MNNEQEHASPMEWLDESFRSSPSQYRVAKLLLTHGISVKGCKAYCGTIEITDTSISRACGVDRRVVRTTLERISSTPSLDSKFSKLSSTLSMVDLAPEIGCSSLVIIPTDPKMGGILASVMSALYDHGISVRQAMVNDDGDQDDATLMIVIDGKLPPEAIPALKACRGVSSILIK